MVGFLRWFVMKNIRKKALPFSVSLLLIMTIFFSSMLLLNDNVSAGTVTVSPGDDIQAKIEDCSPGDTLSFTAGTYTESVNVSRSIGYIDISNLNIHIPSSVTIKLADDEMTSHDTDGACYIFRVGDGSTTVENIHFYGNGTLDGNKDGQSSVPGSGATYLASGIFFHGNATNISVDNITIQNVPGRPVMVLGSESDMSTTVTNCDIQNVTSDGCRGGFLWGHPQFDGFLNDILIRDCYIHHTYKTTAIEPNKYSNNTRIINNTLYYNQKNIHLWRAPKNVTIDGNYIWDLHKHDAGYGTNAIQITSILADGESDYIIIRNNIINDTLEVSDYAIDVYGSDRNVEKLECYDNIIMNTQNSIRLSSRVTDGYTRDNVVDDNSYITTAVTDSSGGGHTVSNNYLFVSDETGANPVHLDFDVWSDDLFAFYATTSGTSVDFAIDEMNVSDDYHLWVNGIYVDTYTSDGSGNLEWTYASWSTRSFSIGTSNTSYYGEGGDNSEISFLSINDNNNNSVVLIGHRYFNWTKVDGATNYNLQISNSSSFGTTFIDFSNISEGCDFESMPGGNYTEKGSYVEFYLPYQYNISWYTNHYYRVRAYSIG